MTFYQEMLIRLNEILIAEQLEYKDAIIIGDNSSGKSDVLKNLILSDKEEKYYFIDAVNRYFDVLQIMPNPVQNVMYSPEINEKRIEEDNFNKRDTFWDGGTRRAIEDFYCNFEKKLKKMMEEFLKISFDIQQGKMGVEAHVDNKSVDLSSGYQALLRIFIEILYFEETKGTGIIVIDEIDEFLSVKNSGRILQYLRKTFPNLHFIVTTHSADLIANAEDINLILLSGSNFEILDANDFSSISQVYDIFESVFEQKEKKSNKEKIDKILRILLNNKTSGVWGKEEEARLQYIKKQPVTKAQKLIIKQIEAW